MTNQKTKKISKQLVRILPVLILALAIIQTAQITHAQTTSNPWAINLQILNNQNTTASVFNPFDQIQLRANVTYNNASQPDVLVSFNVVGPAPDPVNISRIETTQANGEAEFSFRLPIEAQNEDSIIGTWNATATISGAQPQSSNFTTQWNFVTTSVNLLNSQRQNQTAFSPSSNVAVQVAIKNQGQAQPANVTLNMQDSAGQIINQTEILNSQIASSNQTQVQATLQIPTDAPAGRTAINVAIYSGTYNGTNIPAAENQSAYFTVSTGKISTGKTPMPTIVLSTVSFFSWILLATGFFTFTLLYVFLKRKSVGVTSPQIPIPPATIPITPLSPVQPTTSQETTQQPPTPIRAPTIRATVAQTGIEQTAQIPEKPFALIEAVPTTRTAPEKTIRATVTQTDIEQTSQMQEKPVAVIEAVDKSALESALIKETASQVMLTRVNRIQSTIKRIQAIKASLELEKDLLAQELAELNKTVEERERIAKSYFDTVRGEIGKMQIYPGDKEDNSFEKQAKNVASKPAGKPDLESILSKEIVPQAMSTSLSRIASITRRIEALKGALKLEKEQLPQDLVELNKTAYEQEKAYKNHFNAVRQEIEKLKTSLADEED